ncbi:hypothetical protein F5876DRAFT_64864, partial [Lentinula aff. lateritia]
QFAAQEVYLGAEYDHRLMPNFGGPVFALDKAKLIQPNWRNLKNQFIMPWMNYDSLRPGVLVVANIGIRVYVLTAKSTSGVTKKVIFLWFVKQLVLILVKIHHATINSLKVVAESAVNVPMPVAVTSPGRSLKKVTDVGPSGTAKALDVIDWFEVSSTEHRDLTAGPHTAVDGMTDQDGVAPDGKRKKQRK